MAVILNSLAVIVGSLLGLLIQGNIKEEMKKHLMSGIGLCVIIFGLNGALKSNQSLVMILSIVIGAFIGEWLDLENKLDAFISKLTKKYTNEDSHHIAEAFIAASSFMCIGSMIIVGSLESGLLGQNTTLYAKTIMDFITAILLASTMGVGVIFASIPVLLIEGGLTILATLLAPIFVEKVIVEVVAVGSILLIGLGFNVLGISKLKIVNYIPAILLPIILMLFM